MDQTNQLPEMHKFLGMPLERSPAPPSMNISSSQPTTAADLTPEELGKLRELGLREVDRAINSHGAVRDPDKARELLMGKIHYAGGVPLWGDTANADGALRSLPASIFAVPGAPAPGRRKYDTGRME